MVLGFWYGLRDDDVAAAAPPRRVGKTVSAVQRCGKNDRRRSRPQVGAVADAHDAAVQGAHEHPDVGSFVHPDRLADAGAYADADDCSALELADVFAVVRADGGSDVGAVDVPDAVRQPRGYAADGSQRRRGCHADIPCIAAPPRLPRGYYVDRGDAAAATWIFRELRPRRGCHMDIPCIAAPPRPRRGYSVETRHSAAATRTFDRDRRAPQVPDAVALYGPDARADGLSDALADAEPVYGPDARAGLCGNQTSGCIFYQDLSKIIRGQPVQ